jgi:DHA2 family multidrug resistance protein
LILRGSAMGLVLMPAITVAMNTLPGPLIAQGSSLTNVLRQLFSAFGTAIFVTLLQSRQTYHQAVLSQVVTPDLPGVSAVLAGVQRYIGLLGLPPEQANATGVLVLYQQMTLRAAVLSFEDCFLVAAVICLFGILPALVLRSSGLARRPGQTVTVE